MTKEHNKLWDFKIMEEIGKGQSGTVYRVLNKKTSIIQALKKIPIANMTDAEKRETYRQLKILQKLNHPNVVRYYQSFISAENLYIVMDYADSGDLLQMFIKRRNEPKCFKQSQLWNMFKQLSTGLKYLHDQKIIHRDLKLQNIFIHENNTLLIGDLGLSKIIHEKSIMESKRVGTPIYFAPQMIQHQAYSFPVDIWALGCVFFSLTNLKHPFEHAILQNLADIILQQPLKPLKSFYSQKLCYVIQRMLQKDQNKRITAQLLVKLIDNKVPQNQIVKIMNYKYFSSLRNSHKIHMKQSTKYMENNEINVPVTPMKYMQNQQQCMSNLEFNPSMTSSKLSQLLKTVKCMRPRSVRQNSTFLKKAQLTSSSQFFPLTGRTRTNTKSLTKNVAFDYLSKPMNESYNKRMNKLFFKNKKQQ